MRPPAEMTIIQIDITNACPRRCATCSRFCGHHAKPFMMDFQTFKKAVDSLRDFPGIVGISGGEPTLHPEFEKFVRYYRSVIGFDVDSSESYRPQSDFLGYLIADRMDILSHNHRGIVTSIGEKYYEHFELIQDTFGVQLVNDHSHSSRHSTLLITRAELGIPDEEWIGLRDACWLQKYWSASVTPKGAFFCEVAAALDVLLGGPGGWPIEPGWWKRTPADFADQLKWCEMCSAALPTPSRDANDEIDEVSPLWKKKLDGIRSPKALAGLVREMDVAGYAKGKYEIGDSPEPYINEEGMRMAKGQAALVPQAVTAFILAPGDSAGPALLNVVGLNDPGIRIHAVVMGAKSEGGESVGDIPIFSLGDGAHDISAQVLAGAQARDWVLVLQGTAISEDLEAMLRSHVFNPGCLYHLRNSPGRRPIQAAFFNLRAWPDRSGLSLFDVARAYPESKQIHVKVPAISGPWAAIGLVSRHARHVVQKVRGCAQYLESLWSVTLTRPDDAALLWHVLLGKLSRARFASWMSPWQSCWRLGAGIVRRGFKNVPYPVRRAVWVAAWLVFVLLMQLCVYWHTANGLQISGRVRAILATSFILAAFSMLAEYLSGRLLRRPYPERMRSCNALWFVASVAAALLYMASYLVRCGLAPNGLRRPLTLATIILVVAFTAFMVRERRRKRRVQ